MTYQKQLQEAVVFYSGPACTDKETALFDEFRNALLDYAKANRSQWLIMHSYDVSFFKTSFMKFIIQQERSEYIFDLSVDYYELQSQIERDTRRRIKKA